MIISELAGKPAPKELLIDPTQLEKDYYEKKPNLSDPTQLVAFGTNGHRGKPSQSSFNESHVLAIVQAVCDYRNTKKHTGPLFIGKDTHAASDAAQRTALEVLAGNDVDTFYQANDGFTPTPVISHAILGFNRKSSGVLSDGIVITPSHNPPTDGGIKYNTPDGGPADPAITVWIENRANELLRQNLSGVKRVPYESAFKNEHIRPYDFATPYIEDLCNIVDLDIISKSGVSLGVDPLGGASRSYWQPIAEMYKLKLEIVNKNVDPTFSFMCVDHDGKIRMDCSSPYAMGALLKHKDKYDLAFANDPDADRHGIVTPTAGLMNPNHYLAVAVQYLFTNRPDWSAACGVGKTLVSSSVIDRVVLGIGRKLVEVPVGFKWFVDGLYTGKIGFGGEESAGASFLRKNGSVWSTDKDGVIMDLLAAEILAKTGEDPSVHYSNIEKKYGVSCYTRVDQPATQEQKKAFSNLVPEKVSAQKLGGEPIVAKLTNASGNGAPIGGLKVVSENSWFAARPSGTENIYKIYAETFNGPEVLTTILDEAREIVDAALSG